MSACDCCNIQHGTISMVSQSRRGGAHHCCNWPSDNWPWCPKNGGNGEEDWSIVHAACAENFSPWWGPGEWWPFYQFTSMQCHAWIDEYRYKVAIRPPPTCYMKIWFRERYAVGGYPNETTYSWSDFIIFEWQGSNNPCVANSEEKIVEADWRYLTQPDPSTHPSGTTLHLWKYSCLPGYEPDDPIETDPFSLERPCPDPRSNGYPSPQSKAGCGDYCDESYDPEATCHAPGSCSGNNVCGCTDPAAANFNPSALRDDGSCWYEE